jgi:5,10-methylenetetrahydrofolate reductase
MKVSAEALGPRSARDLFAAGADEVLMPCINTFDEAVGRAAAVQGPVTVHAPANRVGDPHEAVKLLAHNGLDSVLAVSGNPGHGEGSYALDEIIAVFRANGLHVSVGAYPEDYFTITGAAHRRKSASILSAKQGAGAQRIITQASFDMRNMCRWLETVRQADVTLPIQVGVMAEVPRKALASVLRNARAEIFSERSLRAMNRPNLDLIFRMLRSRLPDPARFIEKVAACEAMSARDGFHVFAYGADIRNLIEAARRAGA